MKTFYDLTDLEKIELTNEQVQYYAKLQCANEGIIIPQKPINNPKQVDEPTEKYFQVGYESFVFEKMQDAQDYIDAKSKAFKVSSIGNSYDSKHQFISDKSSDCKEIKTIILYTKEQSVDLKSILEYNSEVSQELKEYEASLFKYNEIESSFWKEIQDINYKNSRVDFYKKIYSDYLELAEGSEKIAYTFFDKAYRKAVLSDIDRDIVNEMLNHPICEESNA